MVIIFFFQKFNISPSCFLFFDIGNLTKKISKILAKLFKFAQEKPIFLVKKMTKFVGGEKENKKNHWNFDFSFTISDNDNNDIILLTKLTNINSAIFLLLSFCIS